MRWVCDEVKAGLHPLPERRYLLYCLICASAMMLGLLGLVANHVWTEYRESQIMGGPSSHRPINSQQIALAKLYHRSQTTMWGSGMLACAALAGAAGFGLLFFLTRKSNRLLRLENGGGSRQK
jgi:hypothetical protein